MKKKFFLVTEILSVGVVLLGNTAFAVTRNS